MDGIKYVVVTDKSIRLLVKNQYTSNVELGSTRTEIKHWVKLFFGVKVIAMNSHRLPGKGLHSIINSYSGYYPSARRVYKQIQIFGIILYTEIYHKTNKLIRDLAINLLA